MVVVQIDGNEGNVRDEKCHPHCSPLCTGRVILAHTNAPGPFKLSASDPDFPGQHLTDLGLTEPVSPQGCLYARTPPAIRGSPPNLTSAPLPPLALHSPHCWVL